MKRTVMNLSIQDLLKENKTSKVSGADETHSFIELSFVGSNQAVMLPKEVNVYQSQRW